MSPSANIVTKTMKLKPIMNIMCKQSSFIYYSYQHPVQDCDEEWGTPLAQYVCSVMNYGIIMLACYRYNYIAPVQINTFKYSNKAVTKDDDLGDANLK